MTTLAISIVSHGQADLVQNLLHDLSRLSFEQFSSVEVILTINIEENLSFVFGDNFDLKLLRNVRPLGFGANHNQAFALSDSDIFIVANPDIRISNSFSSSIIDNLESEWGCMAPIVKSPEGGIEDSARRYPTIQRIFRRVFLKEHTSDYPVTDTDFLPVDWAAGMFLIFKSEVYRALEGFDHRYFMYLEDADICRRANCAGYKVVLNSNFYVTHDARRSTFKSIAHLKWHLRSMFRFIFGF